MKLTRTPIEKYEVSGKIIKVKREDSCVPSPGPPFSKVRGLLPHMKALKDKGVTTVGYVESSISMAGWGVAWIAKELGMHCVLYNPQYKNTPPLLKMHRKKWKLFNPTIKPVKAGMVRVNYNICKKEFFQTYPMNSYMLDLGLPLEETIEETAKVWRETMNDFNPDCTIINVGSGTILSGILRGWQKGDGKIIGVTGRKDDLKRKKKKILLKARIETTGLFGPSPDLVLYDSGYGYTDRCKTKSPFPCHPYYDGKAWEWLVNNAITIEGDILFWNIGRMV